MRAAISSRPRPLMCKPGTRYQPRYATRLKDENGGHVLLNAALTQKAEYADILFCELNPRQEFRIHCSHLCYLALCWAAILLYSSGSIPKSVMCVLVFVGCLNHVGISHDSAHLLKSTMPFYLRIISGVTPFCAGFMPVAATYGDSQFEHNKVHHATKGALDLVQGDRDSRYAHLPMYQMFLCFFFNPSHTAPWDIILYQWFGGHHPADQWPERICLNVTHWLQLTLLYRIGGPHTFGTVLCTGHFAMFATWSILHGLLHSPGWYRFITTVDPSGARNLHPWMEPVGRNLLPAVWLGVKWHDVHHAFVLGMPTLRAGLIRGYSYDEVNEALADLVDEGLFVDAAGKGVSPLAEIGHQIGSRKKYLLAQGKNKVR